MKPAAPFPGVGMESKKRFGILRKLHEQTERRLDDNYRFRCAIDSRVSLDEQVRGDSLDTQELDVRAYVEGRHLRGVVVKAFREEGCEGGSFDRPVMREIVQLAKAGKIDCVVWRDAERMGRNREQGGQFVDRLLELGVIVRLAKQHIDETQTGYNDLMEYLQKAESENHQRSDKIAGTTKKKRNDGRWQGLPPFGFDRRPGKGTSLRVKDDEIRVVLWLFDRALAGDPRPDLVRGLRREFGLKWHPNRVTTTLKNRTYIGQFSDGAQGNFLPDGPVVPVVIFEAVQRRFRTRGRRLAAPYGERARTWPFVGVLLSSCGSPLTASESKGRSKRYWRAHCSHKKVKGTWGPDCSTFAPEAVTEAIRRFLQEEVSVDPEVVEALRRDLTGRVAVQRETRQRDMRSLQQRHDDIGNQLRKAALKLADLDGDDERDLRDAMKARRAEQSEIAGQIAELEHAISRDGAASADDLRRWAGLIEDLGGLWDTLGPPEQRELLQILFPAGDLQLGTDLQIRTAANSSLVWVYGPFEEADGRWCAVLDSNQ